MDAFEIGVVIGTIVGPIIVGLFIAAVIALLRTLVARTRRDPASSRRRWWSSLAIAYGFYTLLGAASMLRLGPLPVIVSIVCAFVSVIVWLNSPLPIARPQGGEPAP